MKCTLLATLAAIVSSCPALGSSPSAPPPPSRSAPADVSALPLDVRQALDRAARQYPVPLSGARWTQVRHAGVGYAIRVYQLEGTNDRGNRIETEISSDGRIFEVEEVGIPLDEVPGVVLDRVRAELTEFDANRIVAVYQGASERPVVFGFAGRDGEGKRIDYYISADGRSFRNSVWIRPESPRPD